jgi:hypothetical protein
VQVEKVASIIVTGASRKGCKFQLPQVATYMQVMIICSSLHLLETILRSSIVEDVPGDIFFQLNSKQKGLDLQKVACLTCKI